MNIKRAITFFSSKLFILFFISITTLSNNLFSQVASLYTFSTSAGTYTAITGGTQLYATTFDDGVTSVTIPSFNFNGTAYTSINVSTNGFITFGATAPATTLYTPISGTTGYAGSVSAFAADLNNAASGTREIRYETVGSEFVIQWQDVRRFNITSERISFQIRLNTSTNAISIVYGGTITPGSNTTYLQVGLRGAANTDYNNRSVTASAWSSSSAGGANTSTCYYNSAQTSYVPATGRTYTWSRVVSTTLYNTASNGSVQTSFNNFYGNTTTPKFTLSADNTADRFFIELNTKADFTGTSYTQTFTGSYTSGTKYDLTCSGLSTSLPTTEASYFIRARASTDGGSTWGSYTSTTWVFSKSSSLLGYHYTTSTQFNAGSLVSTNYGNFIVSNSNATTSTESDDYMEVNQGTNTCTLTASADHYLTEGTTNYSGASFNYLTVGGWYSSGAKPDYVGFRFQNFALPQGATVQSAYLNAYTSNTGAEPSPNVSNPLYMKVRAADADNCSAWANTTNTATGDPKNRTRSATSLDWDVTANWTDAGLVTSPDISTVVQDVVSRAGYASGNALGIILDYDGAAITTTNRHRYFSTPSRGAGYKAYLTTTFTNFTNDVQFTNIPLANVNGATAWDQLIFDVDKASCGACDVIFEVRNTSGGTLIATGNTSPISLGASTAANVYVVVRMKRNSSPLMHSFTLTTNSIITLPVEITSFVGERQGRDNELTWVTESEANNDFFTVEKTVDGVYYETVGVENGAGNSNNYLTYKLLDIHVEKAINYYRLKQTDYDGKFTYSTLISIDNRENSSIKEIVKICNILGQEVDQNYKGVVIIMYNDNTILRTYQN